MVIFRIVALQMQNGRLPSDQQLAIVHLLVVFSNLENNMHKVVARWSVEAEYRTMAHTSYKLTWLKNFMQDFDLSLPMNMYCDNQTTIPIACLS